MILLQRVLNILLICVLCIIVLAGYGYQYFREQTPCILCLLQRYAMIGTAVCLTLNLRFGMKAQHYGLAILSALLGRLISLRQVGMHIYPTFPRFGEPILGLDLYVWAFIVFTCSIFSCAVLLILHGFSKSKVSVPCWGVVEMFTFWFVVFVTFCNILTAFIPF